MSSTLNSKPVIMKRTSVACPVLSSANFIVYCKVDKISVCANCLVREGKEQPTILIGGFISKARAANYGATLIELLS